MPLDLSRLSNPDAVAEDSFYFVRYRIDGVSQTRRLHRLLEPSLQDLRLYYRNLEPELFKKKVEVFSVPIPEGVIDDANG